MGNQGSFSIETVFLLVSVAICVVFGNIQLIKEGNRAIKKANEARIPYTGVKKWK